MKTFFLRKTDETIWKLPFLREPTLSTNPLFLSKFFMTPLLCPNSKNEITPPHPRPPLILGKERKLSICLFTYAITVYKFD